jgi:hypothetical protein
MGAIGGRMGRGGEVLGYNTGGEGAWVGGAYLLSLIDEGFPLSEAFWYPDESHIRRMKRPRDANSQSMEKNTSSTRETSGTTSTGAVIPGTHLALEGFNCMTRKLHDNKIHRTRLLAL